MQLEGEGHAVTAVRLDTVRFRAANQSQERRHDGFKVRNADMGWLQFPIVFLHTNTVNDCERCSN